MTLRSILIGLLGTLLMAVAGQYVNKYVPGVTGLVRGQLPVSVFGMVIFFVLALNPLLGKIRASWRLRAREVAVILALVLVGCGITDAGLMRHFPRVMVYPIHQHRMHPGWQKAKLLEQTPAVLLANQGEYSEEVVENYVTPMGEPGKPISFSKVPWHAWWHPTLTWSGIIVLMLLGVVSLSVIVHRQWADKERIRYPLAELAGAVLEEDGEGRTKIVRNRIFWLGVAIPLAIRLINGLQAWFPNSIGIEMTLDFSAVKGSFPEFMKTPGAGALSALTIFPAVIGFTFLLASEIGFSLAIANLLSVAVLYAMILSGADVSSNVMTGGVIPAQNFGAFLGMGLMLLYVGRRYYWQTFKQAATFRAQPETDAAGVWAMRIFIVCMGGASGLMAAVGLDWPLAAMAVGLTMLLFLICARLNAECGTFFLSPAWQMPAVIVGLFGVTTLGPRVLIILGLMMYVLSIDPFECMMPYVVNGLKITTQTALKPGRVGLLLGAAIVLALLVAIPTAIWADYNHAAELRRGWDMSVVYNAAQRSNSQLEMTGELEAVQHYSSWDRIVHMRPDRPFMTAMGVGFGLLIACSVLRLRFAWWPLHPVAILLFGGGLFAKFSFSFLVGWIVKVAVTKFGGVARYTQFRPFMIGAIVGDLMGGFLMMMTNWVYFAFTNINGPDVMPW